LLVRTRSSDVVADAEVLAVHFVVVTGRPMGSKEESWWSLAPYVGFCRSCRATAEEIDGSMWIVPAEVAR